MGSSVETGGERRIGLRVRERSPRALFSARGSGNVAIVDFEGSGVARANDDMRLGQDRAKGGIVGGHLTHADRRGRTLDQVQRGAQDKLAGHGVRSRGMQEIA
jgi:hypothetical protein